MILLNQAQDFGLSLLWDKEAKKLLWGSLLLIKDFVKGCVRLIVCKKHCERGKANDQNHFSVQLCCTVEHLSQGLVHTIKTLLPSILELKKDNLLKTLG